MQEVVGLDPGTGAERALAGLPQERPFVFVLRHAHVAHIVGGGHPLHGISACLHVGRCAVHLHQQCGGRVNWQVCVHEWLDGAKHVAVHHLERGRHHSGGDHLFNHCGGVGDGGKVEQHGANRRRLRGEAHADPRDHAHHAFTAHHHSAKVVPGRVRRRPAEHDHLAVGHHHLHTQHVLVGDPIGEAVRAPCVGAHIAADRARLLT